MILPAPFFAYEPPAVAKEAAASARQHCRVHSIRPTLWAISVLLDRHHANRQAHPNSVRQMQLLRPLPRIGSTLAASSTNSSFLHSESYSHNRSPALVRCARDALAICEKVVGKIIGLWARHVNARPRCGKNIFGIHHPAQLEVWTVTALALAVSRLAGTWNWISNRTGPRTFWTFPPSTPYYRSATGGLTQLGWYLTEAGLARYRYGGSP